MKKIFAILLALAIFSATSVLAGGDQNKNRHDGTKGKGAVKQIRINK
jgi:hypothetical protein